MTTPSGTELTDRELDVLVSEATGWVKVREHWEKDGESAYCNDSHCHRQLPKFSTSRDACATFEATLTEKVEQANYAQEVIQTINDARHGEHRFIGASDFDRITATPRQRCIAFLRMKGVL